MGLSDLLADEIMAVHSANKGSKIPVAKKIISTALGQKGYADLSEILEMTNKENIGKSTVYTAKSEMGLGSETVGFTNKKTYWYTHTDNDKQLVEYLRRSASSTG